MIVLFTDFGSNGPYLGQMEAVLALRAPEEPVINLMSGAPVHDPRAAAYLLDAYAGEFPPGAVFLGVVDPGVGGERSPGVLFAGGKWFVGPDNGLFEITARRSRHAPRWWQIVWRPERLSATFHGRDLFAPVAAKVALSQAPEGWSGCAEGSVDGIRRRDWPDDLAEIVHVDHFGNGVTGMRARIAPRAGILRLGNHRLRRADTFSQVPAGRGFWYENANGLVEIAINQGRADKVLGLAPGTKFDWEKDLNAN